MSTNRFFFGHFLIATALATLVPGAARAEDVPGRNDAASCWPAPPGTDPVRCPPDDPGYRSRWEFTSAIPDDVDTSRMHPGEVELGSIGFSLDTAWQHTIGRDDVVIAVLDSGIRWDYGDLTRKIALNAGELPVPRGADGHDANADGVFDVLDYEGDPRVVDANANGRLDPEDLIRAFSDCVDDDANGYPDDIAGYDFFGSGHCGLAAGDNNPHDDTDFGHGTGIASTAAAETDNGLKDAGVCPRCRVLPVRIGDSFVVDADQFARGVIYAVRAGATVIASATGSYNNTAGARTAIDFAYDQGVPVIASAADEFSYHHNYPSVNNHALYVNAIRHNHATDWRRATTFWGVNPCTNFGARVWITVPATSCSSGATSRLAGAVGLIQSMARDEGLGHLHAEEVYQLLRSTADDLDNTTPDWGPARYPGRSGFDQYYGYGRLNAFEAVRAVREGRIPPPADLDNPRWFSIVSPRRTPSLPVTGSIRIPRASRADYRLEFALGVEPAEAEFRLVSQGSVSEDIRGLLGTLHFDDLPAPEGPPPANRDERDRYSVTLRLRVIDDRGLVSEARRSFFVVHDDAWTTGFPLDIGVSGEAAPRMADLDGDGRHEIVVPSADGIVRIVSRQGSGVRIRHLPLDEGPGLDPAASTPERRQATRTRETVIRSAAIGDVSGDGRPEIVVASRNGKVYVFDAEGERLAPFPVRVDPDASREVSRQRKVEQGILTRPVLADLDGRPGLEIVVTALDGQVYVWRGDGNALEGFPVRATHPSFDDDHAAKIVSTPAVGDIDGDGRPEIVFGSNTLRRDLGAAFAVRAEGNAHPDGPFVPGWRPVEVSGIRPDLLPTIATGVQMEPALADVDGDGDDEVVLYSVTGHAVLLVDHDREARTSRVVARYSMAPGEDSEFRGTTFLTGTGSPLVRDTDGDGVEELYAPLLPFRMLTLRAKPGIPLDSPPALGGWAMASPPAGTETVSMIPSFPRRMEDLMIFARPAAADVDADGVEEVLMGSGGYLLHAFDRAGGEAPGFPKFTGGWIFSAPALGDLEGDGIPELVTVTREGYLFSWSLESAVPAMSEELSAGR